MTTRVKPSEIAGIIGELDAIWDKLGSYEIAKEEVLAKAKAKDPGEYRLDTLNEQIDCLRKTLYQLSDAIETLRDYRGVTRWLLK